MKRTLARLLTPVLLAVTASLAHGTPPEIGYVTNSTAAFSPMLVFGEGFASGKTRFYAWTPKTTLTPAEMIADMSKADLSVPARPPGKPRPLQEVAITSQVATLLLYGTGLPGGIKAPHAVWAMDKEGWSKPYVINRPQLFFLERTTAAPGEQLRVVGRDMVSHYHRHWGRSVPA